MHSAEFYSSPEHWPQPEDDKSTLSLDRGATIPLKKRARKTNTKARKQMTEGIAKSAVAVVGAAVIVGALPEVAPLPDLPTCPICQRVECEYVTSYHNGDLPSYGLSYTFDSDPAYLEEDDLSSMSGFVEMDQDHMFRFGSAISGNKRVGMRLKEEISDYIPDENYIGASSNVVYRAEVEHGCAYYSCDQMYVQSQGEAVSDVTNFFMVALVSYPDGTDLNYLERELKNIQWFEEVDFNDPDMRKAVVPVEGVSRVELQVATNIPELDLDTLISLVGLEISEMTHTYPVGQTMQFEEEYEISDPRWEQYGLCNVYRAFFDSVSTGMYNGWSQDGIYYNLEMDLNAKQYGISSGGRYWDIVISDVSWNEVFTQWLKLNEEAPGYGHEVLFPLIVLEPVEYNGIAYDVYASYTPMEGSYQMYFYYVPVHEPAVMFEEGGNYDLLYSEAQLQQLLQTRTAPVSSELGPNLLEYITLR